MKKHSTRLPVIIAVFTLLMLTCTAGVLCTSSEHFLLHDEYGLAEPEYENRVLNAAETALASYMSMGYKNPVNISDPKNISTHDKIDIYIKKLPEAADGRKVYGSAETRGKNGYGYIEITDDAGEQLEFAVAHEVFHAVQDAYDIQERRYPWIVEGTAELMASRVYSATSGYELINWENAFLSFPEKSLLARKYDATLFWVYISQVYGDSKILEIWKALDDRSLNGIDGVKKGLPDFDADFRGFSQWLYLNYTGNRGGLTDYYSTAFFSAGSIDVYGARYIEINNTSPLWGIIKSGKINFEKQSTRTAFSIKLLKYDADSSIQIYETDLRGSNKKRAFEIPDTQNCSKIVLVISRLDKNPLDSDLWIGEKAVAAESEKVNDWLKISGVMLGAIALFILKRKRV